MSREDDELGRQLEALRGPLIRYFARSVRDGSEIDDLIQEVSLRIVRRGQLEDFDRFAGYVFQTAESVLRDRHRRRVVRLADNHVPFDADEHVVPVSGADRALIARDELRQTSVSLAAMPDCTRMVFVLRRLERLPFAEIAIRLGISLSTAEKHMQRATRQLVAECRGDES
ncbi:RNA polymerase sigma factor [Sphingomonas glacialis]|uniref:RNA polymerase sigma factor n=1 Tax=Sphingomonas glacialis TaxID=658225 RepID=UPI001386CD3A|nr:sigma-70 family RNA polymerase sigma factor [Sphingomonas glacialis]